ncbi:hypothetical protein Vadar_005551 [Vaccinium darrowii]|uniref:Uncharacterized protein n=1 Tax=Vaccinium darrowii TaxID=229202 RepID=A0ACB7Y540_9ERIC|nr:hypothetical protein Vadar_005551 [Vaccinium darrowii]
MVCGCAARSGGVSWLSNGGGDGDGLVFSRSTLDACSGFDGVATAWSSSSASLFSPGIHRHSKLRFWWSILGVDMTIDDDNSVYVGGLPYDADEESIRRVFDLYGHVVAVKIVNDHGIGGKCYGFVTFTNPRSAVDAINDMNGRTIDGRVVRVNEVKTRGGRSNFIRESFRRSSERGNRDRGRVRGRDYDHDEDRHWGRNRDRSRDPDQDKERGHDHGRDLDRTRDRSMDRDIDRGQDRDGEVNEQELDKKRDRDRERDRELSGSRDRELQRGNDHHKSGGKDKDQTLKKVNGSDFRGRHDREYSSESSDDDYDEVEKQLKISNQHFEELQKQISEMEDLAEERRQLITNFQEKSQKLEDALTAAKKLSSLRQMQLTKLHRSFLHVKDYNERLKSAEQELQSLVDVTAIEVDVGNDVGGRGQANGNA